MAAAYYIEYEIYPFILYELCALILIMLNNMFVQRECMGKFNTTRYLNIGGIINNTY